MVPLAFEIFFYVGFYSIENKLPLQHSIQIKEKVIGPWGHMAVK
jgi:hypothetical protein